MSADLVSEDKLTAAIHAGWLGNEKTTERRKENTAEPLKVKKTIANPKTVADLAQAIKIIKAQEKWMMQLQQSCHNGMIILGIIHRNTHHLIVTSSVLK